MSFSQTGGMIGYQEEEQLAPDVCLPSQWFIPAPNVSPYKRLMVAILRDAIECWARRKKQSIWTLIQRGCVGS